MRTFGVQNQALFESGCGRWGILPHMQTQAATPSDYKQARYVQGLVDLCRANPSCGCAITDCRQPRDDGYRIARDQFDRERLKHC